MSIRMAGSIEGGLKYYVGAANLETDGGYAAKVMSEYARLQSVAQGHKVPLMVASGRAGAVPANTDEKTEPEESQAPVAPALSMPISDNSAIVALK